MDDPPAILQFDIEFESLIKAVEEILNSQVGQSDKIDELVKNGLLNKWVEDGLIHHKEKQFVLSALILFLQKDLKLCVIILMKNHKS